jgi:hypothetical protein
MTVRDYGSSPELGMCCPGRESRTRGPERLHCGGCVNIAFFTCNFGTLFIAFLLSIVTIRVIAFSVGHDCPSFEAISSQYHNGKWVATYWFSSSHTFPFELLKSQLAVCLQSCCP